jgi:PIN domain nuclease of toxin-antitoxin system
LSAAARAIISDGSNELFLSAASAWEIAIKAARGSLILPEPPWKYVSSRLHQHHFKPLPIQISHALQVYNLPEYHRDPFDRLLIAQGQPEELPILTTDTEIARYEIKVLW